jgi:formyl-CoA transferase
MLSPYRVLDLTSSRSALGPMILADLGADVVRIEPPGGGVDRGEAPLVPGAPEGMGSVRFHVYNRNKRSVTLDLGSEDVKAQFLDLVNGADFVMEDAGPGAMAAKGLGFDDLAKVTRRWCTWRSRRSGRTGHTRSIGRQTSRWRRWAG